MSLGLIELAIIGLFVLLLFGPGVILVWWLITQVRAGQPPAASSAGPPGEGDDVALVAARERYARGEIDRVEFEEIKSTLGH